MTDIDPLVERLSKAVHGQIFRSGVLCAEAADRIQSDAKIIEELRAALKRAQDHVCMAYCHFGNGDHEDASEHSPICDYLRAALEPKKDR